MHTVNGLSFGGNRNAVQSIAVAVVKRQVQFTVIGAEKYGPYRAAAFRPTELYEVFVVGPFLESLAALVVRRWCLDVNSAFASVRLTSLVNGIGARVYMIVGSDGKVDPAYIEQVYPTPV